MNSLASYITNAINNGEPLELEQLDWQAITDNWNRGILGDIIYKLDSIESVKRVKNSIMKLKAYRKISPPESFMNELTTRCTFRIAVMKREQVAMASRTDQPPAEPTTGTDTDQQQAFDVPQYLTEKRAEKMLRKLESTRGYHNRYVLDRTQTPWVVSSMPDWGKVAQIMQEKLSVEMYWDDWGKLIGKTGKALQRALYKSRDTESQSRIVEALSPFK